MGREARQNSSHLDTCEPSTQEPEAPKGYTVSFRTAWATTILHKNQKQDRGWQAAQCEDKHHKAWCCAGSSVPVAVLQHHSRDVAHAHTCPETAKNKSQRRTQTTRLRGGRLGKDSGSQGKWEGSSGVRVTLTVVVVLGYTKATG